MAFVIASPQLLGTAARDLAGVGWVLDAAHAAAAPPTTAMLLAGRDEVSAAVAAVFTRYGRAYQAVSAQAATFHDQFVRALTAGANVYAGAEAAMSASVGALTAAGRSFPAVCSRETFAEPVDAETRHRDDRHDERHIALGALGALGGLGGLSRRGLEELGRVLVDTRPARPRNFGLLFCSGRSRDQGDPEIRPMQVAVSNRVSADGKSMFHSGGRTSGSSA